MKERKNSPLFVILSFLLLLGFLMDDISTGLIYLLGLGNLETNPIARVAGYGGLLVVTLATYFLILTIMKWLMKTYEGNYKAKGMFYKLYDLFIFLGCLVIVFLVFSKIQYGYNNYSYILQYHIDDAFKAELIESNTIATDLLNNDPEEYNRLMDQSYSSTYTEINFLESLFMALFAYVLMRVDYRISPWGID